MKKILYIIGATMLLSSCTKDQGTDPVTPPDQPKASKLTLTTDWSKRTAGVEIPEQYTVEHGGAKVTLKGATAEYPNTLDPGTYALNLYNTADKVTIAGAIATAENVPQVGFQFFGSVSATIEKNKDHSATVVMQQLTRQLNFDLTIGEGDPARIQSISASLSGVALTWDAKANAPTGAAATIVPLFTKEGSKLNATARLLGMTGAKQELTLNITFTDGGTQTIVSDITTQLTSFNINKTEPLTLSGNINTPIGSEQSGSITDWNAVDGDDITII